MTLRMQHQSGTRNDSHNLEFHLFISGLATTGLVLAISITNEIKVICMVV